MGSLLTHLILAVNIEPRNFCERAFLMEYLRLLRPHQWVKNVFVLLPAFLAGIAGLPPMGIFLAVAAFCLVSSAVYVANDIVDAESDRKHSVKKNRPIASGAVGEAEGWAISGTLAALGLALAFVASKATLGFAVAYLILNAVYSLWTKRVPILDCASISLGFCIRFLAGGVGFGLPISPVLLASCYFGAMSMALIKRRIELSLIPSGEVASRASLKNLTLPSLDLLVGIFGACAISLYSQWALSSGKPLAVFTLPCLSIALSRVIWLAYLNKKGEDFSTTLLSDPFALASFAATFATLALAIYS
jgi:4-hydroxybenzoate polyprenyltransferase